MVSNRPGLILGILTADCTPVLFADENAGVIGAAHAGWKGALTGVLANTLDAMEALGAKRRNITVAVGPTIHQQSYEVGTTFRDTFTAANPAFARFFLPGANSAHLQFDLPGFVLHQLSELGVGTVWHADIDTYASEDHFSCRRTTHACEADYGRQLSAIMLRG
jgi:purine-nucleoside/S-methyl-5'-thioadenosine phosphorylase / adenosine deaminase